METKHGTERSRKQVTEYCKPETYQIVGGPSFSMSTGSHTYTQTEKFCRHCGWVTCKGILGALLCPSCNAEWK